MRKTPTCQPTVWRVAEHTAVEWVFPMSATVSRTVRRGQNDFHLPVELEHGVSQGTLCIFLTKVFKNFMMIHYLRQLQAGSKAEILLQQIKVYYGGSGWPKKMSQSSPQKINIPHSPQSFLHEEDEEKESANGYSAQANKQPRRKELGKPNSRTALI